MDNLTHSLAGAVLGRAGLYGRTRLAAPALIIGANLPDIDVLGLPFGENLAFRRGITHGPIAMALLPIVLTALLLGWARWRDSRRAAKTASALARHGDPPETQPVLDVRQLLLLAYIGVLSHPALDWLNSYGVRLLYPFSDRWFYGDSIFIIDPWIWLALGGGVWLARRRAKSLSPRAGRPARIALTAVAAYIAVMYVGSAVARRHTHEHVSREGRGDPVRVMAAPVPINPFVRSLVVDMGDVYRLGRLTYLPAMSLSLGEEIPANRDADAVDAARATGAFDDFLYWSRFPYFTTTTRGDSIVVRVGDARFPGRGGVSNSFSQSVVVPQPR